MKSSQEPKRSTRIQAACLIEMTLLIGLAVFAGCRTVGLPDDSDPHPGIDEIRRGEYLGQRKPGFIPEVFGPGTVSGDFLTHSEVAISPDGMEVYLSLDFRDSGRPGASVCVLSQEKGRGTVPRVAEFSIPYTNYNPVLTSDGKRLFFSPARTEQGQIDANVSEIWMAERQTALLDLSGPYFGQRPPGSRPELFAPGIVNFGLFTRDIAMTPDGKEFYFRVSLRNGSTTILETRLKNNKWTVPEVAAFSADARWRNMEPCISPDGKQFFFTSNRPRNPSTQEPGAVGIWVMERTGFEWGEPRPLNDSINGSDGAYFPSITRDGTLYFCRGETNGAGGIWRTRRGIDGYQPPERLPVQVNAGTRRYNAFVAPDESYVILPLFGREDSSGGWDYYIVFRRHDDTWREPVNLGSAVNSPSNLETSAFVSRDGKYLFFSSDRVSSGLFAPEEKLTIGKLRVLNNQTGANGDVAIYWVDAKVIENLRPAERKSR